MKDLFLFCILSIPVIWVSRRSIFSPGSHGFYRFFSWECILWIFSVNYRYWFTDPFSLLHLFSWSLLFISLLVLIPGVIMLRKKGKQNRSREDKELYEFEKTTEIIDTGIYGIIRHPLYSSLLFLAWGICLKKPSPGVVAVSALCSVLLFLTALKDEKECIDYFGEKYRDYMQKTRRFIPFLF